jgi:YD repeat-containing protein
LLFAPLSIRLAGGADIALYVCVLAVAERPVAADARGITTAYTNDALDRLTGKSYSDGGPSVTYCYDQTSYRRVTQIHCSR